MEWRVAPPNVDGTTRVLNLDLGTTPIWWKSQPELKFREPASGDTIILKIPGSNYSNRGYIQYNGAYFQVLVVLRRDEHGNYICDPLIDFPIRDKK